MAGRSPDSSPIVDPPSRRFGVLAFEVPDDVDADWPGAEIKNHKG